MLDTELVSACIASRAAYDRVQAHVTDKDMSPAGGFWWKLLGEWYQEDKQARSVDLAVLRQQAQTRITNPKHTETLMGFVSELPEAVSPDNTVRVALELKRYNVGMELGAAVASHDEKKLARLLPQFAELMQLTEFKKARTQITHAVAVEDLFRKVGKENRIPLSPAKLNDRIDGGALPGHHILVFGRPEMGKSTFAINMAGALVRQGKRVLYCGNEDQIDVLKARMLSRITGMTWHEAQADPDRAAKLFRKRGGEDLLRMAQTRHVSTADLAPEIEEFEPQVIVLDQIRNLRNDDENMTQGLNKIAISVRDMLITYGLVGISVTQASSNREQGVWLTMDDVDSSKTGLPAQADLMLGLGADDDMKARNTLAVSIPKNKLSSAPNAHEGIIVEVDKTRAKVT